MSDCVGLKFSVLEDGLFSTSKVDPVYPIAILLATLSKEYFQPYRLTNALIYLQRNGVDLNSVLTWDGDLWNRCLLYSFLRVVDYQTKR